MKITSITIFALRKLVINDSYIRMSSTILRKFIREILSELKQEAVPPGKWAANTGEPASSEDLEALGGITALGSEPEQDDEQE